MKYSFKTLTLLLTLISALPVCAAQNSKADLAVADIKIKPESKSRAKSASKSSSRSAKKTATRIATTTGDWQKAMSTAQELMAAQNLKAAESQYQRALTFVSAQDSVNFAHTLQGLGLTKYYLDDFRSAATLFEKTQEVIDQAKIADIWMVELNYEMLSRSYRHLNQPNRSEIFALKALDYSAEHMGKETRTYALCLRNIGILRHNQHRFIEAEERFSECLDILKKVPDTSSDVVSDLVGLREENLTSLDSQKAHAGDK